MFVLSYLFQEVTLVIQKNIFNSYLHSFVDRNGSQLLYTT